MLAQSYLSQCLELIRYSNSEMQDIQNFNFKEFHLIVYVVIGFDMEVQPLVTHNVA